MRTPEPAYRQSLEAALSRGPEGRAALSARTGISPRTVLRVLDEYGDALVAAGQTRRRRYALRRSLRGESHTYPVYRIDAHGRASELAPLDLMRPEGSLCPLFPAWPCSGEARDGWWDGLPYPLYDMRPQGYLGRLVARQAGAAMALPADPREWSDDDIVWYLSRQGSDCSGDLVIGEASLRRLQESMLETTEPLDEKGLTASYAARAGAAASDAVTGSSAAGEFPKFTARRTGPAGSRTPAVIVKFSGTGGATTRRWADLLVCEHLGVSHAGRLPGIVASRSRVLAGDGRTFLESERFDRTGDHGRRALSSLQAINDHLIGAPQASWPELAERLETMGFLEAADVEAIRRLWWFGKLINNSDMHHGNLAFFVQDGKLLLAPVFDMLPMRYAPLPGGEVPAPPDWQPPLPLPREARAWKEAFGPALDFWQEAAADRRIDAGLRKAFGINAARLQRAADIV